METNFTTRFTRRLVKGMWKEILEPTAQAIKWEKFICDITVRKGVFFFYITLYDDMDRVDVEVCREDKSNYLADKHLPNITRNLSRELKGFWQYAADKAFLEQINEAKARIGRYEKEHDINTQNEKKFGYIRDPNV